MFSTLRFAFRSLCKSPGFTATAVLILTLGIGVNTSMFSVVSAFLLQPAPYPHADRLVRVFRASPQSKTWPHSAPDLDDLRTQNRTLGSLVAFHWWTFSLSQPGQPAERLEGLVASADLFATLGVQPALGRAFTAEEQVPGHDQVVVITDALWRSRFNADPGIIGRTIRVDGANQTVIGVMPAAFAYPLFWGQLQAIRPLVYAAAWQHQRSEHWLNAIACLKPGVSLAQARTELNGIAASLAQQYPDVDTGTGFRLVPLQKTALDETGRNVFWLTLALSGFVLLIACANLANLQLARSAARTRDFAVRVALGASRPRLMRGILAESVVLAFAGGGLGIVLAAWFNDFLSSRLELVSGLPMAITLDWRLLSFALFASFATGLLSGAIPAWLAARADMNAALKSQSRGATGDRSRHRVRHALIIAEIAFTLILLAGAGFFIRGLQRFAGRDPGWQTAGLLTGTITLPKTLPTDRYVNANVRRQFYDRLLQQLIQLPGVEHASLSSALPISGYRSPTNFVIEGRANPPAGQEPLADYVVVSGSFFTTIGLQLVEGRLFPDDIRADSPRYAIVNESLARQFWPGESAVGKRISNSTGSDREWAEILGVVHDVGFVANLGLPYTRLQIYRPIVQEPWGYLSIALRARQPEILAEPLRRAVGGLDPDLPVVDVRTIDQAVDRAQHNFRVANRLFAGFAGLGLLLSAIGLYGVISTLVVQRTAEFGIRLALGAQTGDVLWLVLRKSLWLAALGSALGLVGANALVDFLGRLMPGLPGADPLVLVGIVLLLISVALLACWLPARRATKVDPMVALRAE